MGKKSRFWGRRQLWPKGERPLVEAEDWKRPGFHATMIAAAVYRNETHKSDLAVPEIFDHGLKRLAADVYRPGKGMIDRHDHKKTHEHDDRQNAGHHHLRR